MRKILCILLAALIMSENIAPVRAAGVTLQLETNEYNSNGERHIKVTWSGISGSAIVQLSDNEQFLNAIEKKRTRTQGTYYNFVLKENVDTTYYIRVRSVNGGWSNVVVASAENKIESENTPYIPTPDIPEVPDVSGSVQIPDVKFDFSKLNFWKK